MRNDFYKFVDRLRFEGRNILEPNVSTTNDVTANTGINAPNKPKSNIAPLYRITETKYKRLEISIENMEKELFNTENVRIAKMKRKL